MKKTIALILCLLMVISMLVSCKPGDGDGDDPADTTTAAVQVPEISLNIADYTVIRPELTSAALIASTIELRKILGEATGVEPDISDDWVRSEADIDQNAYEILIGDTNRPQSAAALEKTGSAGFVIELVGNKLVMVGTTDILTVKAVEYFISTYAANVKNGQLMIPESLCYVSEQFDSLAIVENGKSEFSVVYCDGLDNTADDKGIVDYRVQLAKDVREKIKSLTGTYPKIATDWAKDSEDTSGLYEILIGDTNRPESLEAKQSYAVNEYGVSIIGNKVVVTGWSEAAVGLAVELLYDLLEESVVVESDGSKSLRIMEAITATGENDKWMVDIPELEGGTLSGSVTCNHDQIQYYYTDASESAFNSYCDKLEADGYKLYCENEMAGNLFATYTKDSKMVHTYYVKSRNAIRIITGSSTKSPYLPDNVNGAPAYTKITESKITQMTLYYDSGNFGMCYIITLEDGSFIVFDGGGSTGNVDHIRLYNLLNELNERPDGKIVVAAWILTHTHWDHFMGFYNVCMKYGKELVIEQFIANEPDAVVYHNSNNPNLYMSNGSYTAAAAAVGGIKRIKPHTGMKFWVRNAEIEVIYTQEDAYPDLLNVYNDSTMVLRMTIGGQTIMWLGDVQHAGSDVICEMYGNYIKSDMVQVAHHGVTGGTKELYGLISPAIALWPTSSSSFQSQTAGKNNSGYYAVDYYLAKQLDVVDIFVACPDNIKLVLPYTPGSNKQIIVDVPAG